MQDDSDTRKPKADEEQKSINENVKTIVIASLLVALVTGLSSVIYLTVRDNPKSFPDFKPIESQSQTESTKVVPKP